MMQSHYMMARQRNNVQITIAYLSTCKTDTYEIEIVRILQRSKQGTSIRKLTNDVDRWCLLVAGLHRSVILLLFILHPAGTRHISTAASCIPATRFLLARFLEVRLDGRNVRRVHAQRG